VPLVDGTCGSAGGEIKTPLASAALPKCVSVEAELSTFCIETGAAPVEVDPVADVAGTE